MRHNIMLIFAVVVSQSGVALMRDYALLGSTILVAGIVVLLIDHILCEKEKGK